jgi:hypothetical protein
MSAKTLKAILDSLDDLPETITIAPRDMYRPGSDDLEGRYVFAPDGFDVDGYGVVNAGQLRKALEAERRNNSKTGRVKSQTEKELQAARERLAELEEMIESGTPDAKTVEATIRKKLEAEIGKKLEAQIAERDAALEQLNGRASKYREQLLSTKKAALLERGETETYGFNPKIVKALLEQRLRIEEDEESGDIRETWLDARGEPAFNTKGPAGMDDMLAEFAKDTDFGNFIWAKSAQRDAGGAPRGASRAPTQPSGKVRHLTKDEVADYPTYKRIASEAERDGVTLVPPSTT